MIFLRSGFDLLRDSGVRGYCVGCSAVMYDRRYEKPDSAVWFESGGRCRSCAHSGVAPLDDSQQLPRDLVRKPGGRPRKERFRVCECGWVIFRPRAKRCDRCVRSDIPLCRCGNFLGDEDGNRCLECVADDSGCSCCGKSRRRRRGDYCSACYENSRRAGIPSGRKLSCFSCDWIRNGALVD